MRPVWTLVLVLLAAAPAFAQEPILERYALRVGSTDGAGVEAGVHDRFFGHGTARCRITFTGPEELNDTQGTGTVTLRVARSVEPGEVVFALLVFRVEIRGHDAAGRLVYKRDLPGFTFGDSAPGRWSRRLTGVPPTVTLVRVVFVGNYE